jgi:hypothetical protein
MKTENEILAGNRVMTVEEFCKFVSLSVGSGKRVLKSDNSPKIIQLSKRRIVPTRQRKRSTAITV